MQLLPQRVRGVPFLVADRVRYRALAARVLTAAAQNFRCGGYREPPKVVTGQPIYAAPPAVSNVCQEWKGAIEETCHNPEAGTVHIEVQGSDTVRGRA